MPFDINMAYNLVIQACNDPYIGYSQASRTSIQLGVNHRTYCDCSSLMAWACYQAGAWPSNPWFSTIDEPTYLQQAGFTRMAANSTPWSREMFLPMEKDLPDMVLIPILKWYIRGPEGHPDIPWAHIPAV